MGLQHVTESDTRHGVEGVAGAFLGGLVRRRLGGITRILIDGAIHEE
jgi:hypothetical protein